MRWFSLLLLLVLTVFMGFEVLAATPANKSSFKTPPLLYPNKAIVNKDGKSCVLSAYGQCCFFVIDKSRPATYQIPFDRNPAVDFMRIVNSGSQPCEFRMTAEISAPIRLDPAEGLNTYVGGSSQQVKLEAMSDQYCIISVFKESSRSYNEGLGSMCPSPPEMRAPKGVASPAPKAEESPAAEPQQ